MAGMGTGRGSLGPRGFLTEEEKKNVPKVTKELLLRILSYMKPYRLQFFFVFVSILLSATVGLFPSIITGKIVDQALVGKDMALLIQLLIMAFCTLFVSQIIGVLESYINSWIASRIIFDMKNQMYHHLQYMPHSFFTTEKQGDIITRMNTDISGVSTVISGTLSSIVSNVATVVTTLVALLSMNWQLALVGIAIIPLLIIPTKSAGKKRWELLSESQEKTDELNQVINETLSVSGSMLVKIFTREEKEYQKFVKVNEEATEFSLKEKRSGKWFMVVMGMFGQVGPLLIYFVGGLMIIKFTSTTLTVGTITATVALINRLYRPVESLLNIQVDFTRSLALFTRIFDYFDRENTITSPVDGKKPDIAMQPIEYKNVVFSYNPEKELLTNVNFTVPGGKMYAIVGPSGSGKSTVVNLVPRLYDVLGGSVTIAGVDVRDFDLPYLRSQIGVVTQESYLFNGTILDNLRYAKEDATMEEIEAACRIANIHEFITRQPDGYQTEVGNRGLKLSGGEKQRISIARVILKDPKILILDEATSALDSISENSIQDALEAMMKGRTSIVIAHRLSTILKADAILVVEDGVIKEQGTHEELLALGGTYRMLYETQFRQAIDSDKEQEAAIDIQAFSSEYDVKRLTEEDISDVYNLCRSNKRYYRFMRRVPTKESLTEVISSVPEGIDAVMGSDAVIGNNAATRNDSSSAADSRLVLTENAPDASVTRKYFLGFYDKDKLIAIVDLIIGYPESDDAFIGWFVVDGILQGQGIGSQIFADIRANLKANGMDYLSLGCVKENEMAVKFWEGQGFTKTGEEKQVGNHMVATYARSI